MLTAYAELDKDLGYTQGMNFLAGIIFVAVQDEGSAFSVVELSRDGLGEGALAGTGEAGEPEDDALSADG